MALNVYRLHVFLNSLSFFKLTDKMFKTIHARSPFHVKNRSKIGNLVRSNRRLTRSIVEFGGSDKGRVRKILYNSFNMRKVSAKMVPNILMAKMLVLTF